VAHSEPTKVFPKWSPEMAMLSAPFGYLPHPALSAEAEHISKVIVGSNITR